MITQFAINQNYTMKKVSKNTTDSEAHIESRIESRIRQCTLDNKCPPSNLQSIWYFNSKLYGYLPSLLKMPFDDYNPNKLYFKKASNVLSSIYMESSLFEESTFYRSLFSISLIFIEANYGPNNYHKHHLPINTLEEEEKQ